MKKNLYLIVCCLFVFASAKAQYITISDPVFQSYLQSKFPSCFNASGQMDTSSSVVLNADSIKLGGMTSLTYITEIKYFKNLKYLNLSGISTNNNGNWYATTIFSANYLSFPNTIQYLDLSNNVINMWYGYNDPYPSNDKESAYLDIFKKFPDSLKTLKCNNVTFYENYIPGTYTYSCGNNNFPALSSKLEHLEYSFINISGFHCGINSGSSTTQNSSWQFNSIKLPSTLKYLKATQLPEPDIYTSVLPDSVLPSSLKTLICIDCNSANLSKQFSKPTLLQLDTLIIPNSRGFIKYLPNSVKYIDMHETSFSQYLYAGNNHLDTLPYTLDSLQYLDIGFNYNTKLKINAKNLKTLKIDNNNFLTDFTLVNDSLKSFKVNNLIITNMNIVATGIDSLILSNGGALYAIIQANKLVNTNISNWGVRNLTLSANSLKKFTVGNYTFLNTLKLYGSSLDTLNIYNNPQLINLVAPYDTVKSLSIYSNDLLASLSFTSNSLKNTNIYSNQSLSNINITSSSLTDLNVYNNQNLASMNINASVLPSFTNYYNPSLAALNLKCNSMHKFSVNSLPSLNTLSVYSSSLDTLNINTNPKLVNLTIPYDTLKSLSIYGNTLLPSLSFASNSLTDLNVTYNESLANINVIGNTLNNFKLTNNWNLLKASLLSNSIINFSPTYNDLLDTLNVSSVSLKYLNCSNNLLRYLSPNCPVLDTLICETNWINTITSLPNSIRYLTCQSNKLTALPNVPTSLNYFNCNNNLFATMPALPNGIQYVDCSNMGINPATNTKLNTITNLPNSLQYIDCSNNSLVYLPPMSTAATKILCSGNLLHALPALPNTLKYLDCSNNYFLTTMPTLSNVLDTLDCSINNLTRLPSLPNSLKYLDCSKNAMTYLPELPDGLSYLHCWNNDFYCLPKLPSALSEFWVSTLHIACMPNTVNCAVTEVHDTYGTGYYNAVLNPAPPLCNPASNANQCKFKPVMEGTVYYDINSNGIKDANEYYSKNVKVQLSNGAYTFTDNSGHYELTADSLGDYTIKIIAPQYYAAMPDTFHYTFTQYNASVTELVALQPKQNIDSLNIKITPWQNCARPAGNLDYIINYENVGTTNLSPVVTFNYDSSLLTYVKSSNYFVTNSGNKLTLNINSFAVGQTGGFTASFVVKSTDTLGSKINANTAIVDGSSTAVDTVVSTVKSSFDPNDKQATPVLTPLQVALGKDINYTIRFQNTGTDTAFNIVLTDTLSNQLQHNTLQLVSSSNNCKATVKGNVAVFEFLNINLPDSNINSLKSHGFVNFKIKPINSLINGDVVPNFAAAYFDYNTPVNTNTAYTQINASGIVTPVKLISYDARLVNEKTVENSWQTENEVGCSHYNIQRSIDGSKFETIGKVLAGKNSYLFNDHQLPMTTDKLAIYYRLQMMDKNGSYAYSDIKKVRLNQLTNKLINVYPNPAKEFVTIEYPNAKQLLIIDYLGRTIKQINNPTEHQTINTKQFAKGFYAVQVIDKNGNVTTEKLIIE